MRRKFTLILLLFLISIPAVICTAGGSSEASELMWHYLIKMKKDNPDKPVIFSFGNTAASGGYYIASTGDPIFGNRGTVTGSIGVIAGKLSLKGLPSHPIDDSMTLVLATRAIVIHPRYILIGVNVEKYNHIDEYCL